MTPLKYKQHYELHIHVESKCCESCLVSDSNSVYHSIRKTNDVWDYSKAGVQETQFSLVLLILQFVIKKMKCIFRDSTTKPFCGILALHLKHWRQD